MAEIQNCNNFRSNLISNWALLKQKLTTDIVEEPLTPISETTSGTNDKTSSKLPDKLQQLLDKYLSTGCTFSEITSVLNELDISYSVSSNVISFEYQGKNYNLTCNDDSNTSNDCNIPIINKEEFKQSAQNIIENYKKTNKTKEELAEMGFSDDEINKYFYIINENEPVAPKIFNLKPNLQINGYSIKSVDDLQKMLFEKPVYDLYDKFRAGALSLDNIEQELKNIGAENIKIEDSDYGKKLISFTYRGKSFSILEDSLNPVKSPAEQYSDDEVRFFDSTPTANLGVSGWRFTDAEIEKYFDKHQKNETMILSVNEMSIMRNIDSEAVYTQDLIRDENGDFKYKLTLKKDCYTLKRGIVINGFEVKSIDELYYYLHIAPSKH